MAGDIAREVSRLPAPLAVPVSPRFDRAQTPTFFFRVFFRVHCGSKGANTEFIILFSILFQFVVQFASFQPPEHQDGDKKEKGRERA